MIDNTSYLKDVLYGFLTEGGWVAGCGLSHYSPPVISTCNKWILQCL